MPHMQLQHLPRPAPGRAAPRLAVIEARALLLLPRDLTQLHAPHEKGRLRPTTPSSASCARRITA
ncbi:hypothetical protein DFH09DRAFT_1320631 [Mycena vulgaris]|nr:hypothetical protein DFH09DRAFT_1320631 [Mycena vulgaris]